jgi:integrase
MGWSKGAVWKMAKVRYLIERGGSFYARVVVPENLRAIVGKRELSAPLHATSRTEAIRKLPAAVAPMQTMIEAARAQGRVERTRSAPPPQGRALSEHQLAKGHYERSLRLDDEIRSHDARYAGMGVDDVQVARLKAAVAGRADDAELEETVGPWLRQYQANGNVRAQIGTPEWRKAATAVAVAELESMRRAAERDEGDFTGKPVHPLLTDKPLDVATDPLAVRIMGPESMKPLSDLVSVFLNERKPTESTANECRVAVRALEQCLEEARPVYRITRQDVRAFMKKLLETPSSYSKRFPDLTVLKAIEANKKRKTPFPLLNAKTIDAKYLSKIGTILNWCRNSDIIPDNPASGIKVGATESTEPPRIPFTSTDIAKIFDPKLFNIKKLTEDQWAMLVALFTGMRASEQAQIKLDSIRTERGVLVFAIEGKTKNRSSRRIVPVHRTLIELGLQDYVKALMAKRETHLFPDWYRKGEEAAKRAAAKGKTTINQHFPKFLPKLFKRTFMPSIGVVDDRKAWHSFRHTFKTAADHAGVARYMSDRMTGHSDSSAAAGYIHGAAIEALKVEIDKITFDGFDLKMKKAGR